MRAFVNELRLGNFSEFFVELNFAEFSFSAVLRGCKKLAVALINFVCVTTAVTLLLAELEESANTRGFSQWGRCPLHIKGGRIRDFLVFECL